MIILAVLFSLQVHAADKGSKPLVLPKPVAKSESKPLELPKPVDGYPPAQKVSVKKCTPINAHDRAARLANQSARDANAELESPITDCAPGEAPGTAVDFKTGNK